MFRESLASILFTLIAFASLARNEAIAASPGKLDQFVHTTWRAKDGAPAEIQSLAQTTDGWLWLGGRSGLYRFDGVRFETYSFSSAPELLHRPIASLVALENGDLLIAHHGGGVFNLHSSGKLDQLMPLDSPHGIASGLALDIDGSYWFAGGRGLFRWSGSIWEQTGRRQGFTDSAASSVLVDQSGQLWVLGNTALFRYDRQRNRFERTNVSTSGGTLVSDLHGALWLVEGQAHRRVPANIAGNSSTYKSLRRARYSQGSSQFDRQGNLWADRRLGGLSFVSGSNIHRQTLLVDANISSDKLDQSWQLSGPDVLAVLEDFEGNVWVSTSSGLERFTPSRLAPIKVKGASTVLSMATDTEGRVWASDMRSGTVWRLNSDGSAASAPISRYRLVATAADGALLLGGPRTIEVRRRSGTQIIKLPLDPAGHPSDLHIFTMVDDGKILWADTRSNGLIAWVNGKWISREEFNLPKNIYLASKGGEGQLLLGCTDGSFYIYDNNRLRSYPVPPIGLPSGLFAGRDIIVAGDLGMAVMKGGEFHPLKAADPDVLKKVTGIVQTSNGDLWFNGSKGIVHVLSEDWLQSLTHLERPLNYELIDSQYGYQGEASAEIRLPSILQSSDGQLWFMTSAGAFHFNPRTVKTNGSRAQVAILGLRAGGTNFEPNEKKELPSGTPNLSVQYTALTLTQPQRVRFQHRLGGIDKPWVDAGTNRTATYTAVPPGRHRFSVRTYSENGLNGKESSIEFEVAPALSQTRTFEVALVAAIIVLVWLTYSYRRRQRYARYTERRQALVSERERIARTLHDTFLQSIQATIYRLNAAVMGLPSDAAARKELEIALDQAQHAAIEGREQVYDLRRQGSSCLELAVTEAANQLMNLNATIQFNLHIDGRRMELQPEVEEEAIEIAREALRNAFRHSRGTEVRVEIVYALWQFQLRVSDDGMGLKPHIIAAGEHQRHWGLTGMRERAARIGGELSVITSDGTAITLTLPARLAYSRILRTWLSRQLKRA